MATIERCPSDTEAKVRMHVLVGWASLMLGAAGAAGAPSAFPEALARRGCTQEDAPALEIYFTPRPFEKKGEPEAPYIRVEIAGREFARLVGTPMTLSPLARTDRDATKPLVRAEWHSSANEFEWLEGTLTLGHVDAERSVQGSYEFKTRDGQRWTASFGARWVPSHGGCG